MSATVSKRNAGVERVAQRRRQRPDLVERGAAAAPDRVGDLAGAIGGLAALGEPGRELVGREAGEPGAGVAGPGGRSAIAGRV